MRCHMRNGLFLAVLMAAVLFGLTGCPSAASDHFWKGTDYHAQKNYSEALKEFRRAATLMPMDATYHFAVGVECINVGDRESAREQYKVLLRLSPHYAGELLRLINAQQGTEERSVLPNNR